MKHVQQSASSLFESIKSLLLTKQNRTFFLLYFLLVVLLFFYSFTQVDLGLSITRFQLIFDIQRAFQSIGYFNRPLSAILYLSLILFLYLFYLWFLRLVMQKKVSLKQMVGILVLSFPFLAFSYNAFSHDVFNYIFDAKILSFYHLNPYEYKALDFPADPMLAFMHWTHRVYPYGPVWLLLTVPVSFLGLHYFFLTLLLFKLLIGVAFIFALIAIKKILEKVKPEATHFGTAFFALNPLVIIESLVSSHNDIMMMSLLLWGVYYLIQRRHVWAFVFLLLSIGIKFATIFVLPLFVLVFIMQKKNMTIPWEKFFFFSIIAMTGAVIAASLRTTFQPWYLLYVLPFAALLSFRREIRYPMIALTFFGLLNYLPFLYQGDWKQPVPQQLLYINSIGFLLSAALALFYVIRKRITIKI